MGRLTTHVLDTAHGRPAAGMAFRLLRQEADSQGWVELLSGATNQDGRCDAPLLTGADFRPGVYALHFSAGAYFRHLGLTLPEPAFADEVVLQFGLADDAHYHVPLLVSPWSWSTYRGS